VRSRSEIPVGSATMIQISGTMTLSRSRQATSMRGTYSACSGSANYSSRWNTSESREVNMRERLATAIAVAVISAALVRADTAEALFDDCQPAIRTDTVACRTMTSALVGNGVTTAFSYYL